jgi:hypothetical protein
MGRIRRGGYIFTTWKGDHPPRHVHVADGNGNGLGRVRIDNKEPLDDWTPPRKVKELIDELEREGRL